MGILTLAVLRKEAKHRLNSDYPVGDFAFG
jgi:hypothetical protein